MISTDNNIIRDKIEEYLSIITKRMLQSVYLKCGSKVFVNLEEAVFYL